MSSLAEALEMTPSAVHQWKKTPAHRVLEVERITGIPKSQLRPDLYPPRQRRAG